MRFLIVALLLGSFHGALWSLYESTGTIYDILCLTFILVAMIIYVSARKRRETPRAVDALVICALTVLAFESKEIGFTLPALLGALELIFYFSVSSKIWAAAVMLPAGICSAVGIIGIRYSKDSVFFSMAGYTPSFTLERCATSLTAYLHLLSFKTIVFSSFGAIAGVLGALAISLLAKSKPALFGWSIFVLSMLPLLVALPRLDGYVLYVPYVGASIFAGAAVDHVIARIPWKLGQWIAMGVVCGAIIFSQLRQRDDAPKTGFGPGGMIWIQQLTEYATPMCAVWGPEARVAVLNNPFGNDWQAQFVFNLSCNRKDLRVETATYGGTGSGDVHLSSPTDSYATVAFYDGQGYRTLSSRELTSEHSAAGDHAR